MLSLLDLPYEIKRQEIYNRLDYISRLCLRIAIFGESKVLRDPKLRFTDKQANMTCYNGLAVTMYFYDKFKLSPTVHAAAIANNLEIAKWAISIGAILNDWCFSVFAIHGNIEALKWLNEFNLDEFHDMDNTYYPWQSACRGAAAYGRLDSLIWIKENVDGHAARIDSIFKSAITHIQFPVLKWLYSEYPELIINNPEIVVEALDKSHITIVDWFIELGVKISIVDIHKTFDVIQNNKIIAKK